MTFRPIPSPVAGESVLAVVPRPTYPFVDAGWRRRTRLFTGRALDADTLEREQEARAGNLALLGQTLSPGVVLGLECVFEPPASGETGLGFLRIAPGLGIAASGEDVTLGREVRVAIADLLPEGPPPRVAILVAVPVVRWVRGRFDPLAPCERDESEDAFSDEQRVDGVAFELVPWDDAWRALDDATASSRNALAYAIFDIEASLGTGDVAPWQHRGVPLAVLGFGASGLDWLDRYAVVRLGGHAPARTALIPGAGHRALWQARLLQLAAHVDEARGTGALPTAEALGLGLLPPAGIVPPDAVDLAPLTNRFFPPTWRLRAAPIPLEQLDGVLARAASLAPLSTTVSEEVLVLVPVPQAVYEPNLLVHDETPDPLFQQEIDRLVGERKEWLGRRLYLRSRRDIVVGAIDRRALVSDPDPDPDRLEDEGEITPIATDEDTYGIVDDGGTPRPEIIVELARILERPVVGKDPLLSESERKVLYEEGLVPLIEALEAKIKRADDTIDFGFLKTQTDIYRLRQYVLGNTLGSRLATSPALATIARGETSGAIRDDLAKLFATLNQPPPKTTIVPPGGGPTQPRGGEPRAATTGAVRFVSSGATERISAFGESARRAIFETPTTTGPTRAAPELELTASGFREILAGASLEVAGLVQPSAATPDDVRDSTAVIGEDFRTVTIAERLAPPAATEVRSSAKATNYQSTKTLFDLSKLGLNLNDIQVHGFVSDNERTSRPFGELKEDDLKLLLEDPRPGDAVDEAVFFHDAAHVLEGHIATLRNLEARVAQYRELLRECKERLTALRAVESAIGARLEVVGQNVTEARHGVATARTLLAEELVRIERIVARRKAVLAQHVDVLAYVRPRYFDGLVAVPKVTLDPGLLDSPVPACLTGHDDAPTELTELVALLREAPLAWLRYAGSVLEPLNRVELLHRVVLTARTRVQAMQGLDATAPWVVAQPAGRFGKALATVGQAQVDAIWQQRSVVAELDLRQFVDRSWIESRDAARKLVSLGDVIEGSHGKSAAAAAALAELERIERVATCLWARVGEVLPVVRLAWAEALSQYEPGRSLRTLSALPRWRDVDFRLRHDIEVLAEWLLDRVDPENPAALAWMLDLVRVAILLASHAPVDAIVSGQVPTASPANVGALVPVMIDPARVRVGMHVTFFHGGAAVARGIVEDLVGQRARARIAEAVRADLRLEVGVQAQFTSELRALSLRG